MMPLLLVMQAACLRYYTIITYYYVITTQTSIITHYYPFQSPELADGEQDTQFLHNVYLPSDISTPIDACSRRRGPPHWRWLTERWACSNGRCARGSGGTCASLSGCGARNRRWQRRKRTVGMRAANKGSDDEHDGRNALADSGCGIS